MKAWSKKNILRCPVCDGVYEYCHGRVMTPYFRHEDKEMCSDIYTEPETEEHKNGKIALYEWALRQDELTDVVLEGWIPGTHQRPDLMFRYSGKQYVIEFQCSPICTEFHERHELYQAGGVIDIWITGTERYNLQSRTRRGFEIERFAVASFDASTRELIFSKCYLRNVFPDAGAYFYTLPRAYDIDHCFFKSGAISIIPVHINDELSRALLDCIRRQDIDNKISDTKKMIFSTLEEVKDTYGFTVSNYPSQKYIAKIEFASGHAAFIKDDRIDFCGREFGRMPQYGCSRRKKRSIVTGYCDRLYYVNIWTEKFEQITRDCIISAIKKMVSTPGGGV